MFRNVKENKLFYKMIEHITSNIDSQDIKFRSRVFIIRKENNCFTKISSNDSGSASYFF